MGASSDLPWAEHLLHWYITCRRVLPWRASKEFKVLPWQTWVSEVMLQQTTVATVRSKYASFMQRWPDFDALTQASEDDILHFWQGLGYYSRARNLYKGIQYVACEYKGDLPQDLDALKKIPGLGDYAAAAVYSIAFNLPAAAVDGNVARVLSRFWMMSEEGEKLKKLQREKLYKFIPKK